MPSSKHVRHQVRDRINRAMDDLDAILGGDALSATVLRARLCEFEMSLRTLRSDIDALIARPKRAAKEAI